MKVNNSPINTCNNYGINSFELDETKIVKSIGLFDNILIKDIESIKDEKFEKKQIFLLNNSWNKMNFH